jgi:NodT family efflux transporter outer membrane factor (OMF) lipoprotein
MRIYLYLLPLALALSACTLGPVYQGPPATLAVQPQSFARADAAAMPATAPAQAWWLALNDAQLNQLVNQVLSANPDIAIARARLRQSRAQQRLETANGMPKIGASALYAHARLPGSTGDTPETSTDSTSLNLYNVGFDATWEIDLFGGQRRAREAAVATAEASAANLADVQVSLAAETADAYVNLRDRQARVALGEQSLKMQEQMRDLTVQRFKGGTASELDVVRLDNQLGRARTDLLPLQGQMESYLDQLATLAGMAPGSLALPLPAGAPAIPLPPAAVAIGDPGALLRRRPDVRAAERTLAADTAKIGQAEAARYPSLQLLGVVGVGGTRASDLTHLDDFSAIAAPMLSWNFLDFGRNQARVAQAGGMRDEAEAQYHKAVLGALREAEGALTGFRTARASVASLARTKASADRALVLTQQRYQAGTSTLIDLLDTTRQQVSAEQGLSQGKTQLAHSFIAIQKALGLGWSAPL